MEDLSGKFNTQLSERDELRFRMWMKDQSSMRGRNMAGDLRDYDLRGFFKDGVDVDKSDGHFPDKYKKPNHPTFSDESVYHGTPSPFGGKYEGGKWDGDDESGWKFTPSLNMMSREGGQEAMRRYFQKNEPDVQLLMPSPLKKASDRKADYYDEGRPGQRKSKFDDSRKKGSAAMVQMLEKLETERERKKTDDTGYDKEYLKEIENQDK